MWRMQRVRWSSALGNSSAVQESFLWRTAPHLHARARAAHRVELNREKAHANAQENVLDGRRVPAQCVVCVVYFVCAWRTLRDEVTYLRNNGRHVLNKGQWKGGHEQ